jgi:ferredoxin
VRYHVDEALCNGHGLCLATAPAVYSCDDEGFNLAVGTTVEIEAAKRDAAREGAASCPEQAITLFE